MPGSVEAEKGISCPESQQVRKRDAGQLCSRLGPFPDKKPARGRDAFILVSGHFQAPGLQWVNCGQFSMEQLCLQLALRLLWPRDWTIRKAKDRAEVGGGGGPHVQQKVTFLDSSREALFT